ncbi:hypothetical protein EDB83DRAFT_2320869 [Lactarius deliciosus]|nr:hypothetical protein EDB83DRAFT_2320869 [Lactarius deliciosus]
MSPIIAKPSTKLRAPRRPARSAVRLKNLPEPKAARVVWGVSQRAEATQLITENGSLPRMASLGITARACAGVRFRWLSAKTPMSLGKPTYMQSSGTVVVVRVQYKRDWIVALHLPCTHIYCVRPENEKSLELCAELEEDVALLVEKLLLSRLTLRSVWEGLSRGSRVGQVDLQYNELSRDEVVMPVMRYPHL